MAEIKVLSIMELKTKLDNIVKTIKKQDINPDDFSVVVDLDEGGYYNLEDIEFTHLEDGEPVLNLKSSNEI